MTNKELAVQLYSATLQANATVMSNPNYQGKIKLPELDSVVSNVEKLAEQLARIKVD